MPKTKFSWFVVLVLVLGIGLVACAPQAAQETTTQTERAESALSPAAAQPVSNKIVVEVDRNISNVNANSSLAVSRNLDEVSKECISCHQDETPGIVNDWRESRHGHVSVSCLDCHSVEKDAPNATQHASLIGTDVYVSVLVPPSKCAECHPGEADDFAHSGHYRAALQIEGKDAMQTLMFVHEGQNHPEVSGASKATGCNQCHGVRIELDETGAPTPDTWPVAGIGNVYPDGSVGNCTVCHTRHKFDIAEARKPEACASCHLGPDHPDIEIYENSKHGQIYAAEGDTWKWDSAPDAWEPGDYRAPTCATCHMSGIGQLSPTHNVSERLYWNLWAKRSEPRGSEDPMSALTGNAEEGRAKMELVCESCHTERHTAGFFKQGDDAIVLYNESYYDPAKKMLDDLKEKGLLKDNPWDDEFQILFYHLWHHEGRRARQGALMGGPDWAHWHGFFELQQDLYRMQSLYNYRLENNAIETP